MAVEIAAVAARRLSSTSASTSSSESTTTLGFHCTGEDIQEEDKDKGAAGAAGAAGALSGFVARICVSPLDVIKVRMQVQMGKFGKEIGKITYPASPAKRSSLHYTSSLHAVRLIAREEGMAALWKGTVPGLLLWAPYSSVQFATLEKLKQFAKQMGFDEKSSRVNSVAGTCAGMTATILTFPMDTLRTVLCAQGEPKIYNDVLDAGIKILKKSGLKGLYAGLGATLVEVAPYSAVEFGVYSACRRISVRRPNFFSKECNANDSNGDALGATQYWKVGSSVSGSVAGIAARIFIHPLDVVKKRFQIAGLERNARYGSRMIISSSENILNIVFRIIQSEGIGGLFKGLGPGMIKAGVSGAICFTVYESAMEAIRKHQIDKQVKLHGSECQTVSL